MEIPLVSVLIRTHQRPDVLKTALDSVRKQTYPNIQVVKIEDGINTAEKLLKEKYADLNYVYEATGKKIGRCGAGNRALELAKGEYCNFLDDDDAFFDNHIQLLIDAVLKTNSMVAYAVAEERQIIVNSTKPYEFQTKRKIVRYRYPFNRLILYAENYLPIQSVLFSRDLYLELGGFDETLETLEDWDLWVRYSTRTDYVFVNVITSCYHVPYEKREKQNRSRNLKNYLQPIHEKFKTYYLPLTVESINRDMLYVVREYKNKGIIRYLRIFFRVVFLGER